MSTNTILMAIAGVFLILYLLRRRGRLNRMTIRRRSRWLPDMVVAL